MPYLRGSWYSQLPQYGWVDPEDRPNSAAFQPFGKSIPDSQQGIALPTRGGLGKWYNVTPPGSDQPFPLQQTDLGPAKWTGRGVDISAAGAHQMGYTPKNFPTDANFKVEPIDLTGLGLAAGYGGGVPGNNTDVPTAPGPGTARREQQGPKMPAASLYDMMTGRAPLEFNPTDAAGGQTGFGDALASRSNSLIGLGLGLLQPSNPLRGESTWGNALQGFQSGGVADTRQAQLKRQTSQDARQAAMDRFNMGMKEREFARGGETDFQKIQADIQKYGEPARQFYASKSGDTPQIVKITNPNTGEDESVLFNPRAPQGQQFKPMPADIFNPPGTMAPGTAPPLPALTPAPGATPIDPNAPSAAAPTTPRGPADLPPRVGPKAFEPEEKLRKEFNAATKPHQEVRQSYQRLLAAKDSAAGDIALIFGYMRMLDPGSVVREGEFATAQNAASIPDQVRNMYNRALSGERLNPNQRDQFKDQAGSIYEKYDQEYSARADQFRQIAKQNRIDPSRVIPDLGPAPKVPEKAPDVSAIDPRAIKALKANPQYRDQFDAKYGEGAAMRVLTGK